MRSGYESCRQGLRSLVHTEGIPEIDVRFVITPRHYERHRAVEDSKALMLLPLRQDGQHRYVSAGVG